jgi:hypothetical protein
MIRDLKNMSYFPPNIEMFEETDAADLAAARQLREQFDCNSAWLQANIRKVYTPERRGKVMCIAGQELFVGDAVEEVSSKAMAAHPDDKGWFTRYIPKEPMARVYAG